MTQFLSVYGKSSRSEYWGVLCISTVILLFILIIGALLIATETIPGIVLGIAIIVIPTLFVAWLQVATIARRCRDIGINPWFTLTTYIPYIGFIILIVFGCLASAKVEENGLY
jgi:uncharacterized membrane protein YhaH (DUF805 family)